MYTISQTSEQTGVTAHTLRYYEKIGLLSPPDRKTGGARYYTESDVRFIAFINGLKKTGMSLEDITEFVRDGCIMDRIEKNENLQPSLTVRTEILTKHLVRLEEQRRELDSILSITREKLSFYRTLLNEEERSEEEGRG